MSREILPGIKQFDLSGKVAIITGGSKGLGLAMAAGLASAGAKIMLVNRNAEEGIEAAKKNLRRIHTLGTTIPHQSLGRFGSGLVLLKPAKEGTGVIAGGTVRAVMTSAGVQNVLTKSLGTKNPHNVIKATFDALTQLRNKAEVAALRGKAEEEL